MDKFIHLEFGVSSVEELMLLLSQAAILEVPVIDWKINFGIASNTEETIAVEILEGLKKGETH